jgi:hypothetical protein
VSNQWAERGMKKYKRRIGKKANPCDVFNVHPNEEYEEQERILKLE